MREICLSSLRGQNERQSGRSVLYFNSRLNQGEEQDANDAQPPGVSHDSASSLSSPARKSLTISQVPARKPQRPSRARASASPAAVRTRSWQTPTSASSLIARSI